MAGGETRLCSAGVPQPRSTHRATAAPNRASSKMQPTSPYDDQNDADQDNEPINRPADGARVGGPGDLTGDFQGDPEAQDFMNLAEEDSSQKSLGDLDLAPRADSTQQDLSLSHEDSSAELPDTGAASEEPSGELGLDGYDIADQPEVQVDASLEDGIAIEAAAGEAGGYDGDVYQDHFGELEFAEGEEPSASTGSSSRKVVMIGFALGVGIASTMAIVSKGGSEEGAIQTVEQGSAQVASADQGPAASGEFVQLEVGVHDFAGYQPEFEPQGEGLGDAFANAFGEMLTTEVVPPMMGEPSPGSQQEIATLLDETVVPNSDDTFEVAVSVGSPEPEAMTGSLAPVISGEHDVALPDDLAERERKALLSAQRWVEDSRESRSANLSFTDQFGARGKLRVRMAGQEAFEHVWNHDAMPPLEAAKGESELLTPKVGPVRAILEDGELFEGALHSIGGQRVVLQTDIGRLVLAAHQVERLVQLHPSDNPVLNAREVAMGDRVRVSTPGGYLVGRLLKQDEDQMVLVLDSGARVNLDGESNISHLPESRSGAILRMTLASN